MAKPQIVSPDDEIVAPPAPTNEDVQAQIEAQRTKPKQPYTKASSEFRAELQTKANNAALERAMLEAERDGINERIDDLYQVENAANAGLAGLK